MLSPAQIADLLAPYRPADAEWSDLYPHLATYLDLLLKWNARTNLTAIRDPEQIVRRHFGESLFAAQHIGRTNSLLDLGSGAGFPGVPIQLLRPEIAVTLAESQSKKAAFLHELVRTLNLRSEVWPRRAELLSADRTFDIVTLRAVDAMPTAIAEAKRRSRSRVLVLTTRDASPASLLRPEFHSHAIPLPASTHSILLVADRTHSAPFAAP